MSYVTEGCSALAPWRGPLFVIGIWRSGTSLLYALLNKHPQVSLLYEGDLYRLRPLFWIPRAASSWLARWDLWNGALKRHGLDTGRIPSSVSRLQTAMEKAYQEYAFQKGALIWGEKSTFCYDSLTRLARTFPDARFIIIWRDPAAICSSVIRAAEEPCWFDRRGMTSLALLGCKVLKTQCDWLVSRGARVHQIEYEAFGQGSCRCDGGRLHLPRCPLRSFHRLSGGSRPVSHLRGEPALPGEIRTHCLFARALGGSSRGSQKENRTICVLVARREWGYLANGFVPPEH